MPIDSWLPIGFNIFDDEIRLGLHEDQDWQIYKTKNAKKILVVSENLYTQWRENKFVNKDFLSEYQFSNKKYFIYYPDKEQDIRPIHDFEAPSSIENILFFVSLVKKFRNIDQLTPLHDAIYIEGMSYFLPCFSISPAVADDIVVGRHITSGVNVSVFLKRRIIALTGWLNGAEVDEIIVAMGEELNNQDTEINLGKKEKKLSDKFSLPGRPALETFFNEHIVDIIKDEDKYKELGISFPSAIIMHGPPGCGKTFAVEKLIDYLGWPSFQIDSASVGSSYIHGTSKKVAEIFELAINKAPCVLVIDEMESYLAERSAGGASSQHRVEEVAEFLRRIPEAIKKKVLIIAMTNRIDMIDPAILRRGRFDHLLKVDMASKDEIQSLLKKLVGEIPSDDVDFNLISEKLSGRPLSDVAFFIREGARLSVRANFRKLNNACLIEALEITLSSKINNG